MKASPRICVPGVGLVLGSLLLSSGCSRGVTIGAGPGPAVSPSSRATTPPQFPEIAEADWTIEKPLVGHEFKCETGKVRVFACKNVDLLSFLPVNVIGGGTLNDVWGWTDSTTGREFVVVGRSSGTSFVEITDPVNPRYLGDLPRHAGTPATPWRSVKVYRNHAFVVAGGGNPAGIQVFDLTQLRDVHNIPVTFQETAHYDYVASVHSIVMDTATGFAYAVGNVAGKETCGQGMHMVDVRNPLKPTFAGCYAETLGGSRQRGYIHDAQCVVYHGPDQEYRGKEICLNSAEEGLGIIDVTDKQQPKLISVGRYPNIGYTHQGWFTEDQRYFLLDDELDDGAGGVNQTRTIVFDMNDLNDPVVVKEFYGTTAATDHNLYIRGHYAYQSNYAAGLRVLDIADPKNPKEIAYFDTYPANDDTGFVGTWSNYPYFKSGLIAVSNINEGLFIVRHRPT